MSTSRVQPAKPAPGAASALYAAATVWVIAGLLLMLILWPKGDDPADGNGPALLVLAVCMLGATVSFASGATLQRMALWQAAEVEAERG